MMCKQEGVHLTQHSFVPFQRSKPCAKEGLHVNHISCHVEDEYMEWLNSYLKPLKEFLVVQPYPDYVRSKPCDLSKRTHIDSPHCCDREYWNFYKQWFVKVIQPQQEQLNVNHSYRKYYVKY